MLSIFSRQNSGASQPAAPAQPAAAANKPSEPPEAASAPAPPEASGDNRAAARRPASAFPAITGLRISPHGVEAVLINLSESGLLAECSERLKPGSAVTAVFDGTFVPAAVEGRVARSTVASMGKDGRLRYHVGIAFTKRCPLEIDTSTPVETPAPIEAPELAMAAAAAAPAPPIVRNRW